jgi:hypothetical protein
MKKFKYLFILTISGLLFLFIYQNYIYYTIPHNPISEYEKKPTNFHITINLPQGEHESLKSSDMHTCNLIFKYFSDLNLTVERHFTA